jgi:hypothetical protein
MSTPRYDIYARIHKGMRAWMAEVLVALGRFDPADDGELVDTVHRLEELLAFCRGHLEHEDDFIHRAIEARRPGGSAVTAHEHVEHGSAIERLRSLAARLAVAPGPERQALATGLYREFCLFVAENLEHMNREETVNNETLWALFADDEIASIEQALVRSLAPGASMQSLRWMIPSVNPAERLSLFSGLAHAPAPVREGAFSIARVHARAADVAKLELQLAA